MIAGTVFGVVLNDRDELASLADALHAAPYGEPPIAPVVYIKPRGCVTTGGAPVPVPADVAEVTLGATLGIEFARPVSAGDRDVPGAIGGVRLALDVFEPHANYHRPAVRERCRDGFLPIARETGFQRTMEDLSIATLIDGREAHRWSLDRLARPIAALVADLTGFMTLDAGDMLLVGVAGDAPRARVGARVEVRAHGLPTLRTVLVGETAA